MITLVLLLHVQVQQTKSVVYIVLQLYDHNLLKLQALYQLESLHQVTCNKIEVNVGR